MEEARKHLINRLTFYIESASRKEGIEQQRLVRDLLNMLLPLIEKELDKYVEPGTHIQLEKLHLDLGQISVEELPEKILEVFGETLEKAIQNARQDAESKPHNKALFSSYENRELLTLQHVIKYGKRPWWMGASEEFDFEAIWKEWLDRNPNDCLNFIRENWLNCQLHKRLPALFTWDILLLLIAAHYPEYKPEFWRNLFKTARLSNEQIKELVVVLLYCFSPNNKEKDLMLLMFENFTDQQVVFQVFIALNKLVNKQSFALDIHQLELALIKSGMRLGIFMRLLYTQFSRHRYPDFETLLLQIRPANQDTKPDKLNDRDTALDFLQISPYLPIDELIMLLIRELQREGKLTVWLTSEYLSNYLLAVWKNKPSLALRLSYLYALLRKDLSQSEFEIQIQFYLEERVLTDGTLKSKSPTDLKNMDQDLFGLMLRQIEGKKISIESLLMIWREMGLSWPWLTAEMLYQLIGIAQEYAISLNEIIRLLILVMSEKKFNTRSSFESAFRDLIAKEGKLKKPKNLPDELELLYVKDQEDDLMALILRRLESLGRKPAWLNKSILEELAFHQKELLDQQGNFVAIYNLLMEHRPTDKEAIIRLLQEPIAIKPETDNAFWNQLSDSSLSLPNRAKLLQAELEKTQSLPEWLSQDMLLGLIKEKWTTVEQVADKILLLYSAIKQYRFDTPEQLNDYAISRFLQKTNLPDAEAPPDEIKDEYFITNAGLVLFWPYLSRFFANQGWQEKFHFHSLEDQFKAARTLQYLATGKMGNPDFELPLNKLLVGLSPEQIIPLDDVLTPDFESECKDLIVAAITNWEQLKNTSIIGFKDAFLRRNGVLSRTDDGWLLRVERKAYDMLLDSLPYGLSLIRLNWMPEPIFVEW